MKINHLRPFSDELYLTDLQRRSFQLQNAPLAAKDVSVEPTGYSGSMIWCSNKPC